MALEEKLGFLKKAKNSLFGKVITCGLAASLTFGLAGCSKDKAVFYDNNSNEIFIVNKDGTNKKIIAEIFPGPNEKGLDCSTDGKIAFNYLGEIYVMDSDGSNKTNLTEDFDNASCPEWSPDGNKILFISKKGYVSGDIYVMDSDGSNKTNLTNNPDTYARWKWSPNGDKILFKKGSDVYVMNSDGSNKNKLTRTRSNNIGWISNDEFFVESGKEIYSMNINGGEKVNLTEDFNYSEYLFSSKDELFFDGVHNDEWVYYSLNKKSKEPKLLESLKHEYKIYLIGWCD